MVKKISWRRTLPVLGVGLLSAGLISVASNNPTSAHDRGNWNNDTQYFLKLAGVSGDSNVSGHQGEIELDAYRLMEDQPEEQQNQPQIQTADNLADNNLRFIAESSKASPALFEKANNGSKITEGVLTVRKGGKTADYLTIKLTDIVISNYQNSGNDKNNSLDEVVIDYGTLEMTHNEGSPFKKGWDFRNNKEWKH